MTTIKEVDALLEGPAAPAHVVPLSPQDADRLQMLVMQVLYDVINHDGCADGKVAFLNRLFNPRCARTLAQFEALVVATTRLTQTSGQAGDHFLRRAQLLHLSAPDRIATPPMTVPLEGCTCEHCEAARATQHPCDDPECDCHGPTYEEAVTP